MAKKRTSSGGDARFKKGAKVKIKIMDNQPGTIISANRSERKAWVKYCLKFDPDADPIPTKSQFSFDELTVVG